jgi:hypothetical protein
LASDRVLPVHFRLLSLVLSIRGASFVCPALAFELRVLYLTFLVPRPPATPLHNQYTARYVPRAFAARSYYSLSVQLYSRLFLYRNKGSSKLKLISSTSNREKPLTDHRQYPPSQGYEYCHQQESTTQYYRLLPPPAIPELSQVWPDLVRRFILVFVLPSLFPIPVAAAAAPPLEPGTTVLGTDTYKALT